MYFREKTIRYFLNTKIFCPEEYQSFEKDPRNGNALKENYS